MVPEESIFPAPEGGNLCHAGGSQLIRRALALLDHERAAGKDAKDIRLAEADQRPEGRAIETDFSVGRGPLPAAIEFDSDVKGRAHFVEIFPVLHLLDA